MGRPSIAPEKLPRAMPLQAFYSVRSEWRLTERLVFDRLFRWFVGMNNLLASAKMLGHRKKHRLNGSDDGP